MDQKNEKLKVGKIEFGPPTDSVHRATPYHDPFRGGPLDEAYTIIDELLTKRASLFTLGEILWLADDDRRIRFVNKERAANFLKSCQALKARVEEREKMDG